jgi:hypothetical protein
VPYLQVRLLYFPVVPVLYSLRLEQTIVNEPAKSGCFFRIQSTVCVLYIRQSALSTFKSSTVPMENLTVTSTVTTNKKPATKKINHDARR